MFEQSRMPANPYIGLRPFGFEERHLFFGRDGQGDDMLVRLRTTRFLAVLGTSGSGKSSLVQAGLLPALYGGMMAGAGSDWRIAIMRPGADPIGNLADALVASAIDSPIEEDRPLNLAMTNATLRRGTLGLVEAARQSGIQEERQSGSQDQKNLLVVVHQFEELFRFGSTKTGTSAADEAAAFVKLLLEASRQRKIPIYVVLVLRSDFLGDCARFWGLPEAVNEGHFSIPRMGRDQLRQVIANPARSCAATVSPRLLNRILNDIGDNPDQLPILQHTLMRVWDYCVQASGYPLQLDLPHYEAIGTMADALSLHADEAYAELSSERSRMIAASVFKALTEQGADNREIRRRTTIGELCALADANEDEVKEVIESFRREGRSFLTPPPGIPLNAETVIDISHESLIRNWPRLKDWVRAEALAARIYRRVADTAMFYQTGQAALWGNPDLQVALGWQEQAKPNEVWARRYHPEFAAAMVFLDESVRAQEADVREFESRRRRELQTTRWMFIFMLVLFVITLVALIFAYSRRE